MATDFKSETAKFAQKNRFQGKGPLCVALVITQQARKGLPLDPDGLITDGGGQVLGLGKGAVQSILNRHGIIRVLAAEGGRTSRGSLNRMREYVAFLNRLAQSENVDLDAIESYWIEQVHAFFAGKPFKIRMDASRSLRAVIRGILQQAEDRQKNSPGMYYAGAVLQHLVGAKLDCAMVGVSFEHHSFSTSDQQTGRAGDFFIGDVAIHVTTSPSEAVIERCKENLDDSYRPVIVTLQQGLQVAEGLAENQGLADRIDVFEIEQFIALNIYELAAFAADGRRTAIRDIVKRYNEIVEEVETDRSLCIELRA